LIHHRDTEGTEEEKLNHEDTKDTKKFLFNSSSVPTFWRWLILNC
jgi:hypothetical protein